MLYRVERVIRGQLRCRMKFNFYFIFSKKNCLPERRIGSAAESSNTKRDLSYSSTRSNDENNVFNTHSCNFLAPVLGVLLNTFVCTHGLTLRPFLLCHLSTMALVNTAFLPTRLRPNMMAFSLRVNVCVALLHVLLLFSLQL